LSHFFKKERWDVGTFLLMKTTPFRIDVSQETLDDLRARVLRARMPEAPDGAGWSMGADAAFMARVAARWADGYDFRKQETALNAFPQFIADVDGTHRCLNRGVNRCGRDKVMR
jgi:hypothetical protein